MIRIRGVKQLVEDGIFGLFFGDFKHESWVLKQDGNEDYGNINGQVPKDHLLIYKHEYHD